MVLMDRSPETSFEKEVVNDEDSAFILSIDNMHALDALLAELEYSEIEVPNLKLK